ncbi:MAG: hypothetical protein M3R70_00825 [Actinomycetota bacterium]|nr:hypothetical protein [Actinomycetota bacterium]
MSQRRRAATAVLTAAVLLAFAGSQVEARSGQSAGPRPLASSPQGRLDTVLGDFNVWASPDPARVLGRIRGLGAVGLRIELSWRSVAPAGKERPPGFRASDPADPRYRWGRFDNKIEQLAASGLQPIVVILWSPLWAEGKNEGPQGTRRPDPGELAAFAKAASARYSGSFGGLPRVRYWQIWNEPNLYSFLTPQIAGGSLVSGNWYRRMVNAAAPAIHRVHADNVVVAGGTSPFGRRGWYWATSPLEFTRQMLCMKGRSSPRADCAGRTTFDVWAHHPYTAGGPSHHALLPDDVSLPDIPKLQRLLSAAWRAKHVTAKRRPPLWVTEFSWDTSPPDPKAVPQWLQARWVSEAMYRMWRSGVSLVTWFQLRDEPLARSNFQSGLFFHDGASWALDRPKPGLTAFRFPFVALHAGRRVFVWGRTPSGTAHKVVIEQLLKGKWRRVAALRANRFGIFSERLRVSLRGSFRAQLGSGTTSLPFNYKVPPDIKLDNPFGS